MKIPLRLPIGLLFSLLLWVAPAFADGAEAYLKTRHIALTGLITSSAPAKEINSAFDELLDYDALAQTSLDMEWDKLNPDQRKEFRDLLVVLVQRSYTKNIRDTLNYHVEFQGELPAATGRLVKTKANHKTDEHREPISIDYVVTEKGGKWLIRDIVTEGSSLVSNYRNQFRKMIEKHGYPGLIEKMKKKAAEAP
jgi:phospholipid transport system substrate-binding protein